MESNTIFDQLLAKGKMVVVTKAGEIQVLPAPRPIANRGIVTQQENAPAKIVDDIEPGFYLSAGILSQIKREQGQ